MSGLISLDLDTSTLSSVDARLAIVRAYSRTAPAQQQEHYLSTLTTPSAATAAADEHRATRHIADADVSLSSVSSAGSRGAMRLLTDKLRAEIALLQLEVHQLATTNSELKAKLAASNASATRSASPSPSPRRGTAAQMVPTRDQSTYVEVTLANHLNDSPDPARRSWKLGAASNALCPVVVAGDTDADVPVTYHAAPRPSPRRSNGASSRQLKELLLVLDSAAEAVLPPGVTVSDALKSQFSEDATHPLDMTPPHEDEEVHHLMRVLKLRAAEIRDAAVARQVAVATVLDRSMKDRMMAAEAYQDNLEHARVEVEAAQAAAEEAVQRAEDSAAEAAALQARNVELVRQVRSLEEARLAAVQLAEHNATLLCQSQQELQRLLARAAAAEETEGVSSDLSSPEATLRKHHQARPSESWPMPSPPESASKLKANGALDEAAVSPDDASSQQQSRRAGSVISLDATSAASIDSLTRQLLRRQQHFVDVAPSPQGGIRL